VNSARKAFAKWSRTTPGERARTLLAIANAIDDHAQELVLIESADADKPLKAVLEEELPVCTDRLRFLAGAARLPEGKAASEYGRTTRRSPGASRPAYARFRDPRPNRVQPPGGAHECRQH
jgi:acyl-CoA reductase-like NAD-dependent aldehyde dehydrogenase